MLAGVSAGLNGTAHSAHASMPIPEYYHSTHRRNNVYYGISRNKNYEGVNYYLYGRMPAVMRRRGRLFGLYYGRRFNKEVGGYHDSLDRVIRRHGQTYLPDYVGYTTPRNRVRYRGRRGYIEDVLINRKDVALNRPIKNKHTNWAVLHNSLRSIKYRPVTRRGRVARRYYRKQRVRRHRARRRYRRVVRRRRNRRVRKSVKHRYRKSRWIRRRNRRGRKSIKRHYRKARQAVRRLVQPSRPQVQPQQPQSQPTQPQSNSQPQINTPSVSIQLLIIRL